MGTFFPVWHKYMILVDENEIGVIPHSLKQLTMACKICDLVRDHHTCMYDMTLCYHGKLWQLLKVYNSPPYYFLDVHANNETIN